MQMIAHATSFEIAAGELGKQNLWLIELAIAPAAIVSVPIIAWCIRQWPKPQGGDAT